MDDTSKAKEMLIGNTCQTCSFWHRLEKYCIQSTQPESENDYCNLYSKFNSEEHAFNTAEFTEMERSIERRRYNHR
jgi:hypothetical protein